MLFIQSLFSNPTYFFMVLLIVTFSVCLHEYFHAQMAVWEGDYTLTDHLTLNPLKQMGIMSLIMLALVGLVWGSVPVDRSLLRSKRSLLKIAVAGPAANLLLLIVAYILCILLTGFILREENNSREMAMLLVFIRLFGIYNFMLLIFNLIPAPGMDGWGILTELVPRLKNVSSELVKGIMMILIFIAFLSVKYLFIVGEFLMNTALYIGYSSHA